MRSTIKKHADFAISQGDLIAGSRMFITRARNTIFPGDARYGLIATKRTFRHAVDRNRAKRLLRVWIRASENMMNLDMDYVFIARAAILDTPLKDGVGNMRRALKRIAAGGDDVTNTHIPRRGNKRGAAVKKNS